jgi:hypothetical protein
MLPTAYMPTAYKVFSQLSDYKLWHPIQINLYASNMLIKKTFPASIDAECCIIRTDMGDVRNVLFEKL